MTELIEHDVRALRLLATFDALVRPGYFGSCLWPETRRATWAFSRPGGRVLNRLKRAGCAEYRDEGEGVRRTWGWRATHAGRMYLAEHAPSTSDASIAETEEAGAAEGVEEAGREAEG